MNDDPNAINSSQTSPAQNQPMSTQTIPNPAPAASTIPMPEVPVQYVANADKVSDSPTGIAGHTVVHETSATSTEARYQLMQKIKNVAFFGFADAQPETELYQSAFNTSQLLAKRGLTIVDGGGPGVMDAATKGAQSVQGETIAVTFYPKDAPGFEGRYVGNVASKEIVTQNYIERMFKLMEHGDIFVIFNGGTGTISEFGTAWVLARLYFGHHKPFILYGAFWREILDVIQKNMMMRGNELDVLKIATSPEEVLQEIIAFDEELVDLAVKEKLAKEKGDAHV